MKRYCIMPGPVISRTDGDEHLISARQLIDLYRVDPAECVIDTYADYERDMMTGETGRRRRAYLKTLIPLYPRYDGNYPHFPEPPAA